MEADRSTFYCAMTYKGMRPASNIATKTAALSAILQALTTSLDFTASPWRNCAPLSKGLLMTILRRAKKLHRPPQKPYSRKLMLRIPPEVHAAVAMAAEVSGKSINQWAADALVNAACK